MLQKIGRLLGGDPQKKELQRLTALAEQVNDLEASFEALSSEELRQKTTEFHQRLEDGEALDDLLPEAFAAVREASKRTIGLRHYDVQMLGGAALHKGQIVEMRTGEGKTLVATLPVYLNALTGDGVHLVTVNDYLARRDARWMAPIYNALGLAVGVLQMGNRADGGQNAYLVELEHTSPIEDQHQLVSVHRRKAYAADIVYGTNSEFGFDYLRDNLTMTLEERVQRTYNFAIIDEVDNILIDEARTPLIISGPASDDTAWYERMAQIIRQLRIEDYEVNEKDRNVTLTEAGEMRVEELLGSPLRDPDRPEDITPEQARIWGHLEQALKAHYLYHRNKEYLVQGGKVVIVDEFTGRLMPGRRWSEGLHQAVEAKEGVRVEPENMTYATITLQNYFRMYKKLAGMTGTAKTEAEEFFKIYKLDVLQLPTNLEYTVTRPGGSLVEVDARDEQGYKYTYYASRGDEQRTPVYWRRKDFPDVVYRTLEAKARAITQEVVRYHIQGRPLLLGTTSVDTSERLSERLQTEMIRRLMQVMMIRQAWMDKNKIEYIERAIPELAAFNRPLPELETGELRQMARSLGLSLNPEDPANLELLQRVLMISAADQPRLLKVLQGGVPHQVLNARKHTEESQIIARAGAFGSVTIATNMAGRGVDIKLGGELTEELIADVIRVLHHNEVEDPYNMTNEQRRAALLKLTPEQYGIYDEAVSYFLRAMEGNDRVRELGGLHVIGTERHEARRIDNQLRGRAARQGDPGSSRFYLSLEDELMRLFGGQQAEGLFKRLNVDENLPIEHGILGRLVESSQERVEGANFDVRKHLLEYDDVLNAQRTRIYSQRDRVFTKADLSDDVTEMLQTELKERLPRYIKDEEGPWKLLAYLGEIQPPLDFETVHFPTFSLRLLLDEVKRTTPASASKEQLQSTLLDLAHRALEAERVHLMHNIKNQIERAEEGLEEQRDERMEILENLFDMFESNAEDETIVQRRPQDLLVEISQQVHSPLKLSSDQLRRLPEGGDDLKNILRQQIEVHLIALAVTRMGASIERRLEESLELKPAQLMDLDWPTASQKLFEALETVFDRRVDRLVGSGAQIARDLATAMEHAEETDPDLRMINLLRVMGQGSRMAFDRKTHRQIWEPYNRLNYNFLCASVLEGTPEAEITERVLEHLSGAMEALRQAWAMMEWSRLAQTGYAPNQLDETGRELVLEALDEERYAEVCDQPLLSFEEEDRQVIADELGHRQQNEIFRQLLLRVISDQWVDYLTQVEALRVSIGLEAYAQRDPLVMYKGRASEMFRELLGDIRMGVIGRMFTYQPRRRTESSAQPVLQATQNSPAQPASIDAGAQANGLDSEATKKRRRRH